MRIDFTVLSNWIAPNSRVLDLGCGDGALLKKLRDEKNIEGYGLEISPDHITQCVAKGLNVIEQNIDHGLSNFTDNSFDTVVMTQAIQTLHQPHLALEEMLRVGKECVVTFPNFGHWKARLHLLLQGRMPVSDLLPYEWYNTPNIHFCTFRDFEVLCRDLNINVLQREVVSEGIFSNFSRVFPNLFGVTAIYHLSRKGG